MRTSSRSSCCSSPWATVRHALPAGRGRHAVARDNPSDIASRCGAAEDRSVERPGAPAGDCNDGLRLIGRSSTSDFPLTHLAGLSLGVALLGVDFGLCAVAVGSITGSRGTALGVTAALAAVSYLVSSLAPVIGWIRPARYASLFDWSVGDQQLANGLSLASVGVLIFVGSLFDGDRASPDSAGSTFADWNQDSLCRTCVAPSYDSDRRWQTAAPGDVDTQSAHTIRQSRVTAVWRRATLPQVS